MSRSRSSTSLRLLVGRSSICDSKQLPAETYRESFTEVVMLPVLREQLKVINPWLEDDQIEEVIKQLTANFPGTGLIQNNRHVLQLLLENTSVSENRKTGEKSPTVRFIDFKHRDNNRFIAVCQFKVRILGTEHHIYPGYRARSLTACQSSSSSASRRR